MWDFVKAGGWLMIPLILCSIAALAIIIERFIRLKRRQIAPYQYCQEAILKYQSGQFNADFQQQLSQVSLGRIFLKGYEYRDSNSKFARMQMQAEATVQINDLEKNINFLGTIGAITPLLGLLGTVLGIIQAFLAINVGGTTDPAMLANGVSKALITTAMGMIVAIPALIFYRYFQRVIVEYVVEMEQQATLFHAAIFYQPSEQEQQQKQAVQKSSLSERSNPILNLADPNRYQDNQHKETP